MAGFKFRFSRPENLNPPKGDRFTVLVLVVWLAITFAALGSIWLLRSSLPTTVPLFYSRIWGVDRLAKRDFLFLLPAGSLFLGLFNLGFAVKFLTGEKVLSRLLEATTVVVALLMFLAVYNIMNLMR